MHEEENYKIHCTLDISWRLTFCLSFYLFVSVSFSLDLNRHPKLSMLIALSLLVFPSFLQFYIITTTTSTIIIIIIITTTLTTDTTTNTTTATTTTTTTTTKTDAAAADGAEHAVPCARGG